MHSGLSCLDMKLQKNIMWRWQWGTKVDASRLMKKTWFLNVRLRKSVVGRRICHDMKHCNFRGVVYRFWSNRALMCEMWADVSLSLHTMNTMIMMHINLKPLWKCKHVLFKCSSFMTAYSTIRGLWRFFALSKLTSIISRVNEDMK